jgi:DNA-binding IscR family transcriptional regulator
MTASRNGTKPRRETTKKQPFCWQEKHVLRTIRDMFEATGNVGSALLVYHALTEIASDKQTDTFVTTCAYIGQRAGLSARTVNRILPTLENLDIITIQRNKICGVNAPSTYTIIRGAKPIQAVASPCRHAATNCNAQSRSLEESLEESPEQTQFSKENYTHHSDEWRCYYLDDELQKIDAYNVICVPRGWFPVDAYSEELQEALSLFEHLESDEWRTVLTEAVDQRDAGDKGYNTPRGAKLIRICWNHY